MGSVWRPTLSRSRQRGKSAVSANIVQFFKPRGPIMMYIDSPLLSTMLRASKGRFGCCEVFWRIFVVRDGITWLDMDLGWEESTNLSESHSWSLASIHHSRHRISDSQFSAYTGTLRHLSTISTVPPRPPSFRLTAALGGPPFKNSHKAYS
jgi:hypothetical protein